MSILGFRQNISVLLKHLRQPCVVLWLNYSEHLRLIGYIVTCEWQLLEWYSSEVWRGKQLSAQKGNDCSCMFTNLLDKLLLFLTKTCYGELSAQVDFAYALFACFHKHKPSIGNQNYGELWKATNVFMYTFVYLIQINNCWLSTVNI